MTLINHIRNLLTGFSKINISFRSDGDMVLLTEILHGNADTGLLKTKLISDINRTDNGFLLAEDENCLQLVLSGFI